MEASSQKVKEEKGGRKPADGEQMVSVPASLLAELTKRLERMERGEPVVVDDVERNKTARLRKWDEQIVVGWENPYSLKDATKSDEENLVFKIKLLGSDGLVTVNYLEFLRTAERVEVEITNIQREDTVQIQGYTEYTRDEQGFPRAASMKVPIKVVTPKYTASVKLPTGEEFTMDADYLNA